MRLPADLASDEVQTLCFLRDEVDAADQATAALLGDVRFEHLDRAEQDLERLVIRWAPTDRPAAAEEDLHRAYVLKFGRLPEYVRNT